MISFNNPPTLTTGPLEIEINGILVKGWYDVKQGTFVAPKEEIERRLKALEAK